MNMISQSAMRDFLTCRYLYLLKHRRGLEPAVGGVVEGSNRQLAARRGQQFHRAVQQYLSGLASDSVRSMIKDDTVRAWFEKFVKYGMSGIPDRRSVETWATAPLAERVLIARYDLLAWDSERLVICDWKTGSRPIEDPDTQIQTMVYRYVAACSGQAVTGTAYLPEQIEIRYWYVRDDDPANQIAYSQQQFKRDEVRLRELIAEIAACNAFPKTDDVDVCKTCLFRAVCRPEIPSGTWEPEFEHTPESMSIGWGES
ncbi:MAG: hypothetical protein BroJett007_05620 [Chloroflexota bacterium]|nr:MAG: hypothetical protein BroJett007_05620 [Chloroflexota bacterium]